MNVGAKVKVTGRFLKLTPDMISVHIDTALREIGRRGVRIMREKTEPHDFSGDLTNSIMWATFKDRGAMDSISGESGADVSEIASPPMAGIVDMGSALEYAVYRELGSGAHLTDYKTEYFIENLKEWCRIVLNFDPDAMDSYGNFVNMWRFSRLLAKIREHGTEAAPFALTSVDEIQKMGLSVLLVKEQNFWASLAI